MKTWYITKPDEIIESIRVKEDGNRFSIDVFDLNIFSMTVGEQQDYLTFDKEEMRNIYEFLKRFYG